MKRSVKARLGRINVNWYWRRRRNRGKYRIRMNRRHNEFVIKKFLLLYPSAGHLQNYPFVKNYNSFDETLNWFVLGFKTFWFFLILEVRIQKNYFGGWKKFTGGEGRGFHKHCLSWGVQSHHAFHSVMSLCLGSDTQGRPSPLPNRIDNLLTVIPGQSLKSLNSKVMKP